MTRSAVLATATVVALAAGGIATADVANAATAAAPTCTAAMSSAHPAQYSTDIVRVTSSRTHSAVTTKAYYKSTTTSHTANTGSGRTASVAYKLSRASKGYAVKVVVTVTAGGAAGRCTTSFTPS